MKAILLPIVVGLALPSSSLVAQDTAPTTTATYLYRAKVKNTAGEEAFSAKVYADKLKLEYQDTTLVAKRAPQDGKRKFKTETSDETVAEIKLSDDGFKLRDPAGKLLWKVKFYDEKMKISDNEKNENPYELRIDTKAGRVKVSGPQGEIAAVKLYPEKAEQKVKPADDDETHLFSMKSAKWLSPMQGVLALEKIPQQERMILAAELALREFEAHNH